MYAMTGMKLEDRNVPRELDIFDPDGLKEFWEKTAALLDKNLNKYRKAYERERDKRPGKIVKMAVGTFCYLKDYSKHVYPKLHAKYYRAPFLIIKEYPSACLIKNIRGQVFIEHKNNLKRVTPRKLELYNNLPAEIKLRIGDAISYEDLAKFFENGKLPEFFEENEPEPTKPKTRSQKIRPENDTLDFPLTKLDFDKMEIHSDEESDSDDEVQIAPVTNSANDESPRVTFAPNT